MARLILILISGIAIVFLGPLYAQSLADEPAMTGYEIVLFLHQLLFVYWLGPDIGVYIWSRKIVNPELTPEQRVTAGKMIRQIDLIPRVCIALMLTVGGILTEAVGLDHPAWQMAGIILLGPFWLTLVLVAFFREGTALGNTVAKLDFWFRWALIAAVIASTAWSFSTGRLAEAPWVGGKLMIFAAVVLFGQIMRLRLRPFMEGLDKLASGDASDAVNQAMASSFARATPFMIAIWVGLLWAALLGVVQPGSPEADVSASVAAVPG
jgi:hypothetical protein